MKSVYIRRRLNKNHNNMSSDMGSVPGPKMSSAFNTALNTLQHPFISNMVYTANSTKAAAKLAVTIKKLLTTPISHRLSSYRDVKSLEILVNTKHAKIN